MEKISLEDKSILITGAAGLLEATCVYDYSRKLRA